MAGQPDMPRHGRPADHGRKSARRAADHDILRRAAFEPHRVNENVKSGGESEQAGRQPVDRQRHQHDRGENQRAAEFKRGVGRPRGPAVKGGGACAS